jgi:hypothetical protein
MNQNMLVSMKHTSEALQTLGLKVSDADNIMLDLEESASDVTNLQNTLSTSSFDNDFTEMDLHEELALLLGDDDAESIGRHTVKCATGADTGICSRIIRDIGTPNNNSSSTSRDCKY